MCLSLGLPVSLPEEPMTSFLSNLPEVCYTHPSKYGDMFSYSPQMATRFTQCCEPCFL